MVARRCIRRVARLGEHPRRGDRLHAPGGRRGCPPLVLVQLQSQPVTVAEVYSGDNSDFAGAQDFALPDMCHAWGVKPRILELATPSSAMFPCWSPKALSESGCQRLGRRGGRADREPAGGPLRHHEQRSAYDPPPCLGKEFAVDPASVTGAAKCETETPEIDWVLG